jgi:hypothetical protein
MADSTQRRSNLETLKIVMTVKQKYDRVRKQYQLRGRDWHVSPKHARCLERLADMYVRFCEKQYWHTNEELDAIKSLADMLVHRHAELHGHRAPQEVKLDYSVFEDRSPTGASPDLWRLWHAELEGEMRENFLAMQGIGESGGFEQN